MRNYNRFVRLVINSGYDVIVELLFSFETKFLVMKVLAIYNCGFVVN